MRQSRSASSFYEALGLRARLINCFYIVVTPVSQILQAFCQRKYLVISDPRSYDSASKVRQIAGFANPGLETYRVRVIKAFAGNRSALPIG